MIMKNKLLNLMVTCMLIVAYAQLVSLQSCTDITDVQKEWLDKGEAKYVGKLDLLQFRAGLNRVKMEGLLYWAKTAKRGVISWNDQKLEFDIDDVRIGEGDTASLIIRDLEEGTYQFTVQLFDDYGNKSVPEISFGNTYGANYKLQQNAKHITTMTPFPDGTMLIVFNSSEDAIGIELKYESLDGSFVTKSLPGTINDVTIENYKKGGSVELITKTLPELNAFDTIALDVYKQNFPLEVEFTLDRTKFAVSDLPTDTRGNGHE